MKRKALIKHLKKYNCELKRNGSKHDIYENLDNGKATTVPRHPNVKKFTCRSICKTLEIPPPTSN